MYKTLSLRSIAVLCAMLLALFAGPLTQAQTLRAPKNIHIEHVGHLYDGSIIAVLAWDHVDGAEGFWDYMNYQVYIKGPGKWRPSRQGGWRSTEEMTWPDFRRPLFRNGRKGRRVRVFKYLFVGLHPGKTYSFRVRAIDKKGNTGRISKRIQLTVPPKDSLSIWP